MSQLRSVLFTAGVVLSASVTPTLSQEIPQNCLTPNLRKPCVVPESVVRDLTPEQRAQAIAYARQNGIRWRIAKGR